MPSKYPPAFGIDFHVRKDRRIELSDDEIIKFFAEALMEDDWDAQRCPDELANRS